MKIRSIGIDLGKTTFHLVALGERSKTIIKKKFSRKQASSPISDRSRFGDQFFDGSVNERGLKDVSWHATGTA
jgi:hypothetical protein